MRSQEQKKMYQPFQGMRLSGLYKIHQDQIAKFFNEELRKAKKTKWWHVRPSSRSHSQEFMINSYTSLCNFRRRVLNGDSIPKCFAEWVGLEKYPSAYSEIREKANVPQFTFFELFEKIKTEIEKWTDY